MDSPFQPAHRHLHSQDVARWGGPHRGDPAELWHVGGRFATRRTPGSHRVPRGDCSRGPVVAEVLCRVTSGARRGRCGSRSTRSITLSGGRGVFARHGAAMTLDLSRNFSPEHVLYRHGKGAVGTLATWRLRTIRSRCSYSNPGCAGGSVYDKDAGLGCTARTGRMCWRSAACNARLGSILSATRSCSHRPKSWSPGDQSVVMTLPLEDGRRRWLIAAVDKEASLEVLRGAICAGPHCLRNTSSGTAIFRSI